MSNTVAFLLGFLTAYVLSGLVVAALLISRALGQKGGSARPPGYRTVYEPFSAELYSDLFRTKEWGQVIWHAISSPATVSSASSAASGTSSRPTT